MTHPLLVPSKRQLDLIGVGECMVELSSTLPLQTAKTLDVRYGGDVMNALVMAGRLGANVGFVSKVGNDVFGPGLLERWREENIDLTHSLLVDGRNGLYLISLLGDDTHEFWYYRAGSAASNLGPADIDGDYIARSRAVLLSGITQAISETAQAATLSAAQIANKAGTLVFFDPNVRTQLWADRAERQGSVTDGPHLAHQALEELLPYVDCVLPSHPSDAAVLSSPLATLDPAAHAEMYIAMGASMVAMKLGTAGSRVFLKTGSIHESVTPVEVVRDSTGAGDAWNGAFALCILKGHSLRAAARYANMVAAWKVGHYGAIPFNTVDIPSMTQALRA